MCYEPNNFTNLNSSGLPKERMLSSTMLWGFCGLPINSQTFAVLMAKRSVVWLLSKSSSTTTKTNRGLFAAFRHQFRSTDLFFNPLSYSSFHTTQKISMSSDEAAKAIEAASTDPAINPHAPTFFDKIIDKKVYSS